MNNIKYRVWTGNELIYPEEQYSMKYDPNSWHYANPDFVLSPKGLLLLINIEDGIQGIRFFGNAKMSAASISFTNPIIHLFTGYTDINGKDIYEQDIVSYKGVNYLVVFENVMDGCKLISGQGHELEKDEQVFEFLEIVGNIEQNLDLLK